MDLSAALREVGWNDSIALPVANAENKILQEAIKKQIEADGNEITFDVQERK